MLLLLHSCVAIIGGVHAAEFNVLDYKAVGDGVADDTKAFEDAWATTCASTDDSSRMVVPAGKTFLVKPTTYKGPCKCSAVNVEVSGGIIAPEDPREWKNLDASIWLKFDSVNGSEWFRSHRWTRIQMVETILYHKPSEARLHHFGAHGTKSFRAKTCRSAI